MSDIYCRFLVRKDTGEIVNCITSDKPLADIKMVTLIEEDELGDKVEVELEEWNSIIQSDGFVRARVLLDEVEKRPLTPRESPVDVLPRNKYIVKANQKLTERLVDSPRTFITPK